MSPCRHRACPKGLRPGRSTQCTTFHPYTLRRIPARPRREVLMSLRGDEMEEIERDVLFFDMWGDRRAALRAADSARGVLEALQAAAETRQ